MSQQAKTLTEHKMSPFDLTEFDQWVNEAGREDLKRIYTEYLGQVFGLKLWSWEKFRDQALTNAHNFEVNLIFKNEDEDKANEIIQSYKRLDNAKIVIDQLFDLAIESITWV